MVFLAEQDYWSSSYLEKLETYLFSVKKESKLKQLPVNTECQLKSKLELAQPRKFLVGYSS